MLYKAVKNPGYALLFENGHVFDRLSAAGISWRVYHHHGRLDIDFPQVLCLKGMVDKRNDPRFLGISRASLPTLRRATLLDTP